MAEAVIPEFGSQQHRTELGNNLFLTHVTGSDDWQLPLPEDQAMLVPELARQILFRRMVEYNSTRAGMAATPGIIEAAYHYSNKVIDSVLEIAGGRCYNWSNPDAASETAKADLPILFLDMPEWMRGVGLRAMMPICVPFAIPDALFVIRKCLIRRTVPWHRIQLACDGPYDRINRQVRLPALTQFDYNGRSVMYDHREWDFYGANPIRNLLGNPFMVPSKDEIDRRWNPSQVNWLGLVCLNDILEGCAVLLYTLYTIGYCEKTQMIVNGEHARYRREKLQSVGIADPFALYYGATVGETSQQRSG